MRARSAILALALSLLAAGAAGAKVRTVKSLEGIDPGKRVRIEGVVSLHGSTPFTILVLETGDGEPVPIQPHTPALQHELTNLDGVRVALEGEVLPLLGPTLPRLDVDRYDILAPPGAGKPITGMITVENDACVLTTNHGKRYWIVGDLTAAMCQHIGARVWMVGKKGKRVDGERPAGSTPFTATGYGVIE